MFIPFGFYKSPAAGSWTPADLPNLYDYWEADSGVTGTTNVSQWSGKENGNNFIYNASSKGPELITSNAGFNNQDILRFDRSNAEQLYFNLNGGNAIGGSTQVNFSMYADPEAITSGGWRMFMGFSRDLNASAGMAEAIIGSNSSAFRFYTFDGGGKTTVLNATTTPKQLMTVVLDYANAQGRVYFGTTQDSATPVSEPGFTSRNTVQVFTLFGYNPENSTDSNRLSGDGDLGGVAIWTGDDDFSTNLDNLNTYFQNKYGAS